MSNRSVERDPDQAVREVETYLDELSNGPVEVEFLDEQAPGVTELLIQ